MENQTTAVKKNHVLVVDDSVELVHIYKEMLEGFHYAVSTAFNGVQALKLVLEKDFDAIICDLTMPQLEGDLFYAAVERAKPHLCPRFIIITGNAADPKYEAFLKKVDNPVLYKPVSAANLLDTLDQMVGRPSHNLKR
ncbi:MAG TPA: response regulator [Verrucomicrobiae bacterium]|jgi:CheY-like chemotaxis protein|nr:response regulator [Verrucomicrobiae bacterium]